MISQHAVCKRSTAGGNNEVRDVELNYSLEIEYMATTPVHVTTSLVWQPMDTGLWRAPIASCLGTLQYSPDYTQAYRSVYRTLLRKIPRGKYPARHAATCLLVSDLFVNGPNAQS